MALFSPVHLENVQVTPAHDPNDFATGKRHNLEFINIFDDNGLINDKGGLFKGQPRFKVL
jgi:valyl-tRNA synthetase